MKRFLIGLLVLAGITVLGQPPVADPANTEFALQNNNISEIGFALAQDDPDYPDDPEEPMPEPDPEVA